MIIEQLISPIVPTLLPSDTGSYALDKMEAAHLTQLPMVKEKQYMALIQETDVLDWSTPEHALDGADFLNYKPAVFAGGHPFDALRMAHEQNLTIVPVVDSGNNYMGAITRDDLLKYITENSGLDNPGGILVLEMEARNYSLTEIARLCENEDVLVISTQLTDNVATGLLEVTLKTNRTNLEAVVSSFERHGYTVKEVFGAQSGQEDIMARYASLMNYLNV